MRAHKVEELLLIFHGAAPDGPADATCAYYHRVLPGCSAAQARDQQVQDLADARMYLDSQRVSARVRAFRAEVRANRQVQFVKME